MTIALIMAGLTQASWSVPWPGWASPADSMGILHAAVTRQHHWEGLRAGSSVALRCQPVCVEKAVDHSHTHWSSIFVAAFMLLWLNPVNARETTWPTKSEVFPIWPLVKKIC
jgi:hypothetical protein